MTYHYELDEANSDLQETIDTDALDDLSDDDFRLSYCCDDDYNDHFSHDLISGGVSFSGNLGHDDWV